MDLDLFLESSPNCQPHFGENHEDLSEHQN